MPPGIAHVLGARRPVGGWDYPRTYQQFRSWFPDEMTCREYLGKLRWPNGSTCPRCGCAAAGQTGRGLWMCTECALKTSATPGTIFTARTPRCRRGSRRSGSSLAEERGFPPGACRDALGFGSGRLWTTHAGSIPLEQAQAPHEAETLLQVRHPGTANALALWFSADLAPGSSLSVGPGDPPTHWGMTTAPLRLPWQLTPNTLVRAKVRTAPARPIGTWTRWAIAMPGTDWEEHDEQSVWQEMDD